MRLRLVSNGTCDDNDGQPLDSQGGELDSVAGVPAADRSTLTFTLAVAQPGSYRVCVDGTGGGDFGSDAGTLTVADPVVLGHQSVTMARDVMGVVTIRGAGLTTADRVAVLDAGETCRSNSTDTTSGGIECAVTVV